MYPILVRQGRTPAHSVVKVIDLSTNFTFPDKTRKANIAIIYGSDTP